MKRFQGVALVSFALMGLLLVVARCGSDPSAAATDAGRALAAMSSGTNGGGQRAALRTALTRLRQAREALPCDDGADFPSDIDGLTCTLSCDRATSAKITTTCTMAGQSTTCKGTTYTMKSGTFTNVADFTDVTLNADPTNPLSGTVKFSIDAKVTVSGGSFSDTDVACKMSISTDIANPTILTPACEDFTCTIAGVPVGCEEMQQVMEEDGSCA